MTTLIIRPEVPEDVAAIETVTAAAFLYAPHTDHNEQFILAGLRDAGALTVSLVAEMDGSIVGNVAMSPVSISDGTEGWFGVGPVSVIPKLQGHGIGSQLMRAALQRLSEQGASGCVVLGDPSYYQRFGFTNEASLVLPDVPPRVLHGIVLHTTATNRYGCLSSGVQLDTVTDRFGSSSNSHAPPLGAAGTMPQFGQKRKFN